MAKSEGWRPGGGTGPTRRGPKAEWMPTVEPPKKRTRRYKQAALALLALLLIGAGVWLYRQLTDPAPPVLIVITTDPETDATNLSTPIDPYGWLSGKALLKWSENYGREASTDRQKHAPKASDGSGELKKDDIYKSEADLAKWAAGQTHARFSRSEIAIVYFGLHTGADANGAFLYANQGRRLHVKPLLKALSDQMGSTKVLVLFDPGRQLPDPASGQLHDGFVDGVISLQDDIAGLGNLTVILGCDSGERGWESEELQRTAFAHFAMSGLSGAAPPADGKNITAADLFNYVKQETEAWTLRNRPTVQHPIMIPSGDAGQQRASAANLVLHLAMGGEPLPAVGDPLPILDKTWKEYAELMNERPKPEIYTPRHWRRYRALLLRYEFVVRSGETRSQGVLEEALRKESAAIRDAQKAGAIDKSATTSTPMWQAAGAVVSAGSELRIPGLNYLSNPTPDALKEFTDKLPKSPDVAYSDDLILKALKPDEILAPRAALLREIWNGRAVRPSDVQLALMLDQFYRGRFDPNELPSEVGPDGKLKLWQRALEVRRLAEHAAIGPTTDGHAYSETIWRCVRPAVWAGDLSRRQAEDLLFAPADKRAEVWTLFEAAAMQYQRAVQKAGYLREALALRDRVMADLPFLGRWAVFEGEGKIPVKSEKLWDDVHKLAKLLDEISPDNPAGIPAIEEEYQKLRAAAESLNRTYEKLTEEFARRLAAASRKPENLQDRWSERERLLAVLPLSMDGIGSRRDLIKFNRESTKYFIEHDADVKIRKEEPRDRANAEKGRAAALGYLGKHELGDELLAKQAASGKDLLPEPLLKNDLIKFLENGKWEDAAQAGERIGKHYRALAEAADTAEAERFSRVALSFDRRDGPEPAEANRKLRWQRLHAAQALRTVHDHWYQETWQVGDKPYFKSVAEAFLEDAERLAPHDLRALLDYLPNAQFERFEQLRKADPLSLAAISGDHRWTTESRKLVNFTLSAAVLPDDAKPIVWAEFADSKDKAARKIHFAQNTDARRVQPIEGGASSLLTVQLETADAAMSIPYEKLGIRQSAFFRGQLVPAKAELALNRIPDMVYTHARAAETDKPRVAFVGPNNIDVGIVSIVIDYSPSMTSPPRGEPRIKRTLEALEQILSDLPDGTELIIRGFGVMPGDEKEPDALDYESVFTRGGIDINGAKYPGTFDRILVEKRTVDWKVNKGSLRDVMVSLHQVKYVTEGTYSPVVRSMRNAVRKDFNDAATTQTKVVIVLTDGEDNSSTKPKDDPQGINDFEPLKLAVEQEFTKGKGRGVTARIVLITDDVTTDKEKKQIEDFKKSINGVLGVLDTPGKVEDRKIAELGKELAELLRPRVRLNRDDVRLDDALRSGLPIRFNNRRPPEPPSWTALPIVGEYQARVGQNLGFQTLSFKPADALLVRLSSNGKLDKGQRVQYERVVWGDPESEFGRALAGRQQKKAEQNWLLSAVMLKSATHGYEGEHPPEIGRHIFDLRAAVENVEPLRLKPTDGQTLEQPAPDFIWWELAPSAELRQSAPLYIWREYGHPAPVWRFRRWDWLDKKNDLPASTLRGWLPKRLKLPEPRTTTALTEVATGTPAGRQPDGATWTNEWKGKLDDGQEWTAKFAWELHSFAANPDSQQLGKPLPCLVVRVYLDKPERAPPLVGKRAPLFAQVSGIVRMEEHRFFRDAGAYTGYFHFGESTVADPPAGREVKLYAAIDLTDPKVGIPFELAVPKPDSDGKDLVWNLLESVVPKPPQ